MKNLKEVKMIELESVGCVLDPETAEVYPLFEDGSIDLGMGVSLTDDEMPGDWIDALSEKDLEIVKKYVNYL